MTVESKLPIDGLRTSHELALITAYCGQADAATGIFGKLARRRINVVQMTLDAVDGKWTAAFCVDAQALEETRAILSPDTEALAITAPVGTLTLFPHRCRIVLLSRVLTALRHERIPVLAIGSSVATLVFATDFRRLEEAVAALCTVAALPDNPAPPQQQMRVWQI